MHAILNGVGQDIQICALIVVVAIVKEAVVEDQLDFTLKFIRILVQVVNIALICPFRLLELDQLAITSAIGIAAAQHRWLFGVP
ncbi:hypothetical protein KJ665_02925 [Patescibacteria group bacterium]|nr:hypothetical protein [Patescibacteria group bacterium]